ncbi:MAG: DUF5668 domain-containing protein [Acidobacteriia bacterium]|nr:DUF5668 domain-containing protein [Terriglobia bacterium]
MNCANHADASAVAYCRTCGKALCANCTRPVRGVIYCEDCLGAKMEGAAPPASAGFVSGTVPPAAAAGQLPPSPPGSGSGPNPALAGILGAIPFGVGAVYNGQYAKGLAHLVIFSLLVAGAGASGRGSGALHVICAFGIAFFVIYQIVDAVRSARAIQANQPTPDPFGLAQAFSPGAKIDTRKIPTGAVVLIVLGVLFLLSTAGLFELDFGRLWPALFILLGGWLFAVRWGLVGTPTGCTCERCRARGLMAPAIFAAIGVVGLVDGFRDVGFFGYVGAILLVIGGVKLFQGGASAERHIDLPLPPVQPSSSAIPVAPQPTTPPSEVSHG